MIKHFSFKNLLPYFAAIIIFMALALAYSSPVVEGKRLKQNDITQYEGASKELRDFHKETGEYSQWTGSMFSGMPSYQISVSATGNKIKPAAGYVFGNKWLPYPVSVVFLYCLGFFVLLLVLRVNPWLSLVGAVAFAFSSYFFIILEAGHVTKSFAIAYMPFVVAGIVLLYQKKYLWGTTLTTLFMALELGSNHPQITYYLGLCMIVFGISEFINATLKKTWKPFWLSTGCLVFALGISFGVNANLLLPTYEYSKETIRGKSELTSNQEIRTSGLDLDYATQWSYGKTETFTLMIPDFMGGANARTPGRSSNVYDACIQNNVSKQQAAQIADGLPMYWGAQPFTSGPVYVGAIVCFLFVLGLFIVKGRYKWWLLIATVLSVFLAWGKNFMPFTEFFMHYIPGYNKFRAVSMTLVIAELTIPLLGFLALKNIWDGTIEKAKMVKGVIWSLGITGGLCLIFALFKGAFFDFSAASDAQYGLPEWLIGALEDDRAAMMTKDALRSLLFIGLAAATILLYLKEKMNKTLLTVALAVLILGDMWTINKRYVNDSHFVSQKALKKPFELTRADKQILEDKDPNFRVFNQTVSPFNDATTSYNHKSIGGYHGAKLRRYQDIIDRHLSKGNMDVFNMLNAKYFISRTQDGTPMAQRNPEALGNAWFVDDYLMVENADEEIAALDSFNPATTAVIDQRFDKQLEGFVFQKDSAALIVFETYKPNHLKYTTIANTPQMAVFSEVYYDKGWNAYIDGKLVPHFRANYILRGMVVPEGEHVIEFKFEPRIFRMGEALSFTFSMLVFAMIAAAVSYSMIKKFRTFAQK
ncbi:MAG: YfhO family protein [Bacteroidales bacterium]|nr:YfhO family protein [Bacteroidales bacterium]